MGLRILAWMGLILVGCRGMPKEARIAWSPPRPERETILYRIGDHKNREAGADLPAWVLFIDEGDLRPAEYLPEYQDRYLFAAKNRGTNFKVLELWNTLFQADFDVPELVAARMQERFALFPAETATFPEQEYGAFFEITMKAAYNAIYADAVVEDDFWIQKQYVAEDGLTIEREEYVFFILVSIGKEALQDQINNILNQPLEEPYLSKEQSASIYQLKAAFFNSF
ncbi:MAG: hypothetical protein LBG90_02340 [Spirochaetaceae bacterium]|nr:hypothetical protein [Spirochaetaceae bacterium]